MKHGGIIAAALEVLADIETRHRPATEALRDWGVSHRFAGAGDRAQIGNLVFDALRCRTSLAWRMGAETPRAIVLGAYRWLWERDLEHIEVAFASDRHAPELLTDSEKVALRTGSLDGAPAHVAADYPEWLHTSLARAFGDDVVREGQALCRRAPVDLRVNTQKADRGRVLRALARVHPAPTPFSPVGIRVAVGDGPARAPHLQAEPGYRKGWFEIQDEGSQLAALLAGARSGMQVADVCAGAGGKTLALSAAMSGKGQVHAWDADRYRLADIHERIQRAGARNVQVLHAGDEGALKGLEARMDVVLVDAPCTGTGVWRRRPDAKWRVSEKALAERLSEQRAALELAAPLVRPGGQLVYVTCSLLPEENDDQIAAFLTDNRTFGATAPSDVVTGAEDLPEDARAALCAAMLPGANGVMLTPARTGTDGFFISVLTRHAG